VSCDVCLLFTWPQFQLSFSNSPPTFDPADGKKCISCISPFPGLIHAQGSLVRQKLAINIHRKRYQHFIVNRVETAPSFRVCLKNITLIFFFFLTTLWKRETFILTVEDPPSLVFSFHHTIAYKWVLVKMKFFSCKSCCKPTTIFSLSPTQATKSIQHFFFSNL